MKKRVILAVLALVITAGCSNGEETSVSEPESTAESSVVSVAENTEVSENSVESREESSKKESSVESKAESSAKESSVESKAESKTESKAESKTESKAESKVESKVESKTESKAESKAESKVESKVESKPESRVESKVESKPESKVESGKAETSVPATNAELPGFYNLVEMTSDGESLMSMKYYNEAGLYITLEINAGGTGVFTQYQDKSNMTWNDNYMMLKDYDDMEYSLSGDKLAVYQSDVITLVFERSDKETIRKKMEEASKEKELSGEVDKEAVGKYVLKSIDSEESIDEDLFGEDVYVVLNDDGTGYFDAEGEQIEIEWVDGAVKIMNDVFYYEKHGNDIVIEIYGITITFSKE